MVYCTLRSSCLAAAASLLLAGSCSTAGSPAQPDAENGCELALGNDATCHLQFAASVAREGGEDLLEKAAARAAPLIGEHGAHDKVVVGNPKRKDGLRILVGTVVIGDADHHWILESTADRPDWIRAIFERNQVVLRRHGHGMVVRESAEPLELLPWQREICGKKAIVADGRQCAKNFQRENANWQKEAMLAKYLGEPWLTHVAVIDADVVLTQLERDTLGDLAEELDREQKDLMLADEDWRATGAGKINGGFILARVTNFSQHFFRELARAHEEGPEHKSHRCTSNEQLCLRGWLERQELQGRVLVKSGSQYNCHPKVVQVDGVPDSSEGRPLNDRDLHAVHFMGASKAAASRILAALNGNSSSSSSSSSSAPTARLRSSLGSVGGVLEAPGSAPEPPSTCNDGSSPTACFSIDECLAGPRSEDQPRDEKYAFVLAHSLEKPLSFPLPHLSSMKYVADRHGIDILFMVPQDGLHPLDELQRLELNKQGVKLIEVPWSLPPGMRYTRERRWCGRQDFIRTHMFNITGYSAVAYYDNDVEIQGDVVPALQCAARGYLLSTSGPYSPLNLGFMAVRPSPSLLEAALDFARQADFSPQSGWAGGGFLPHRNRYVGSGCGQGFFHTLFYKKTELGTAALNRAGVRIVAKQLDRCEWNYQLKCPRPGFECGSVRAHHKGGGSDCSKLGSVHNATRRSSEKLARRTSGGSIDAADF